MLTEQDPDPVHRGRQVRPEEGQRRLRTGEVQLGLGHVELGRQLRVPPVDRELQGVLLSADVRLGEGDPRRQG